VNEEQLSKTVSELSAFGKIYGYKVDITDYNKVYEMAEKVKQDIGSSVDILINNAGVVMGKSLLNATEKEIMLTLNVNTLSHFWTTRAFLPGMIEKGEGHIVTVASACGIAATSGMPDYVTSKFAVIGFNDALRVELKQNPKTARIRTLCVCPYYINTGMFKGVKNGLLPLLEPEYVANRIVNSIQRCDEMLIMPWACKTAYLVKFLLPIWIQDLGLDLMGVTRSMQSFKGRTEKSHISTMKKLVNKTDIDS
jgi:short-subunit dehydrogenase